jgi:3-hydroxybutyryl-CoA dehydratase
MSDGAREPRLRTGTAACLFSELTIGDRITDALTVTEAHVVLAAAIFNDPGPNHVNALQASGNRFGERIVHGPLLIGIMDGALGNVLGSTIVALLEQHARFRAPARLGDTVLADWRVTDLTPKPDKFSGGGVVTFAGEALNQNGQVLVEMTAVMAVADRPLWELADHLKQTSETEDGE